jgi:hypothetical protein
LHKSANKRKSDVKYQCSFGRLKIKCSVGEKMKLVKAEWHRMGYKYLQFTSFIAGGCAANKFSICKELVLLC